MSYTAKSTLPEEDLKTVGEVLQGALTDLVDLALVAKQIHWTVVGPRFRSVHLQLDEVVSDARKYSDQIAERASAVGIAPDGRSATVASHSTIGTVKDGWLQDSDAVQTISDALYSVIVKARERMATVGKLDPVTEDIFIQIAGDLEKHRWMFEAENHT